MNPNARQNMAMFSFILGILSLIFLLFGFSMPLAALGIILALLSRGGEAMAPRARSGLILSALGLVIGIAITVSSIVMLRSGAFQDAFDEMRKTLEMTYSEEEADEVLEQLDELFGATPSPSEGGAGK